MSQIPSRPVHRLHKTYGNDIMLYNDCTTARRIENKDNGFIFSAHPIKPYEKFAIKLFEVSTKHHRTITIGFTTRDPATLQHDLPKKIRDLKHNPHFWLVSLSKRHCVKNHVLFFYVDSHGSIRYGVDEDERHSFEKNVDINRPLWALIDICSSPTTVEVVSTPHSMKRMAPPPPKAIHYKFTSTPLVHNEYVIVKILDDGNLSLGVTSCNPSNLDMLELPLNLDLLLDRPEYWVIINDPTWIFKKNDEISFVVTPSGAMNVWKNKSLHLKVLHVDQTLELWGFFKMDNVHRLQVSTSSSYKITTSEHPQCTSSLPPALPPKRKPASTETNQETSECVICCESAIEAALYPCGHMCMCYECAQIQWRGAKDALCPICRAEIKDVLKIFKP